MWKKLVIALLLAGLLLVPSAAIADECADKDVGERVNCYEAKLNENLGKQKTLASTISYLDNKIFLLLAEIQQTEEEVKSVEEEIATLSVKINRLDINLNDVSRLLVSRVGASYKRSLFRPILMLFSSSGLTDFFERSKYLQAAQLNDRKILLDLQTSRDTHQEKKDLKQEKQDELESLRAQLSGQKVALGGQKQEKETLLQVTRNDEGRYQRLLSAARAEQQALSELFFKDGKVYIRYTIDNLTQRGSISANARVGTMGDTGTPGCSTGAHLHLEYITEGKLEDNKLEGVVSNPFSILQNKNVKWFNDEQQLVTINVGGGGNLWPLNNPIITQMFGQTPYSYRYRHNFHTAIDIVDLDDRTVTAINSGTLYTGTLSCPGSSLINTAIIDHGGGAFSTYLHLDSF